MATRPTDFQTTLSRRLTRATAAAAAIMLTIGLSACGGSSDSTAEPTPEPTETTSSPTPEETEEETSEEETTPEEIEEQTTEEETTEESSEPLHEFIAGATPLSDAMKKLRALSIDELQQIIDAKDVQTLAFYKSVILLNSAEYLWGLVSADCEVDDITEMNPLFYDVRKMTGQQLFCATAMQHIAPAQTPGDGKMTWKNSTPLDTDLATKVSMIDMGIPATEYRSIANVLKRDLSRLDRQKETSRVRYNIDLESTTLEDISPRQWVDGKTYESILVRFIQDDDPYYRRYLLVPLPEIIDFPGDTESGLQELIYDYNHIRVDESGKPITKDTGKEVLIPIFVYPEYYY